MAFKPEEVCLGMYCYSLKAQYRRLGLSGRWPNPPNSNIMIQSILCWYNTGGSTNMTLLSTYWICDIKQTQQCQPNNLIHYHSNWTTVNLHRPLKVVSSHEWTWILLRGCWVDIVEFVLCCKFSLWISVSCFYYRQYYTGTQLIGSVILSMIRELCSYQVGRATYLTDQVS